MIFLRWSLFGCKTNSTSVLSMGSDSRELGAAAAFLEVAASEAAAHLTVSPGHKLELPREQQ